MKSFLKRLPFIHINRYQQSIILPVVFSCLIACNIAAISLAFFYYPDDFRIRGNFTFGDLKLYAPGIIGGLSLIQIIALIWTYFTASKIVGPYERVIRELDDVIAGKSKKPITTRDGDEMFEEILRRVNQLIKRIP